MSRERNVKNEGRNKGTSRASSSITGWRKVGRGLERQGTRLDDIDPKREGINEPPWEIGSHKRF